MLYSGIDLHKHSLVVHTVDEQGSAVREAEFATTRPALSGILPRSLARTAPSWSVSAAGTGCAIWSCPKGLIFA
jgi:hypothetical protein